MNFPRIVKWIAIGIIALCILIVVIAIPSYLEFQDQMEDSLISILNPIITGWSNYHQSAVSKDIFGV